MHSGKVYKTKSNKELYGFLFNDFLLLTYMVKQFVSSGSDKLFSPKSNAQYKMYKVVSVREGSPIPNVLRMERCPNPDCRRRWL